MLCYSTAIVLFNYGLLSAKPQRANYPPSWFAGTSSVAPSVDNKRTADWPSIRDLLSSPGQENCRRLVLATIISPPPMMGYPQYLERRISLRRYTEETKRVAGAELEVIPLELIAQKVNRA